MGLREEGTREDWETQRSVPSSRRLGDSSVSGPGFASADWRRVQGYLAHKKTPTPLGTP